MRHLKKKGRKFGRVKKVRKALLKSLLMALVLKGRIKTTEAKAKELNKAVGPLVTKAKKGGLYSIRLLAKTLPPKAVSKLIKEIGPRYQTRAGGYTRIIKTGEIRKDGARMCYVEFV
ncbi:MAG: 50S ribosomal protein L17 [Parcubacteria group bacterium]|nr:50S ribosomal protein L17 [Parcubacteria group bacterium]